MYEYRQSILLAKGAAWRRFLWSGLFLMFIVATGLMGCGKGEPNVANEGNGELSIALTDAEGDFVSYTVDVVSLTLTKANGSVVETLPLRTRIDFAKYTDMTEFLSIATIPAGVYVRGEMVLDYSNAEILVENADGQPVNVAADAIKDSSGNVISRLNMLVQLEGRNQLTIVRGVPAHLSLDFDLKQSNAVIFTEGVPELAVQPRLIAEVNAENHKQHRVRGPLRAVNVDNASFQVHIRPFFHHISRHHPHFGVLNVQTDDETYFEINGESYKGAEGLALLAEVAQYSAVAVLGDIRHHPRRFIARQVYAGSGVPGGDMDVVHGSVVERSGDLLTVKGISFLRNSGSVTFNDTVSINIDNSTTVLKALNLGTFNKDDVSVGQLVTIFGAMEGTTTNKTMDATNGYARMELTYLRANRVEAGAEAAYGFVLNLVRINGRDIAQYDFAGTGSDAANDADAGAYEVNTGVLDVSSINNSDLVRVRGHVAPFGAAPADFDAVTVIALPTPN